MDINLLSTEAVSFIYNGINGVKPYIVT